jgi:N-acetyl-beta-hexosaminidase
MHSDELNLIPRPRTMELRSEAVKPVGPPRERIDPSIGHAQGYTLEVAPDGAITIVGNDPAGLFYGKQTLKQIERQCEGAPLPVIRIADHPDFPVRGVMLDISRDKVPTMQTLFALVDQFAELKLNQLQLYTEHTFAYAGHETVWKDASPMTGDEIRQLDRYCQERFIELVPNQNSFGHLERWFKHPHYHHLAEQPAGFVFPWGNRMPTGFSLNPTDPRSLQFVEGLFDQLLPNFSSRLFNVG